MSGERPGEAAAVEAIARELAAMIDGGPSHPSPVDREYAAMLFAAAYPVIAEAVRAEERKRIAQACRALNEQVPANDEPGTSAFVHRQGLSVGLSAAARLARDSS